jgi:epoxide hydrolase 4
MLLAPPLLIQSQIRCGDISLQIAETGQGPPIIFLHGFPEHWRAFLPMMQALAPEFRCIAPDQRGYGQSSRPLDVEAYHIDILADDIAKLLLQIGQERAHVVAHDWGGLVAWHFAGRHPDLLDRLVIFNAPHPFCLQRALDETPAQRLASNYAARFAEIGSHQFFENRNAEDVWTDFFGADEAADYLSSADKAALLRCWQQPAAWQTMLNWYRAAGFDYGGIPSLWRPKPQVIKAPTLLIYGARDPLFTPSAWEGHDEFVENFQLDILPEGGHSVFRQYRQHCHARVRSFLSK